ncbi:Uncharacterised protein [Vibrio cholerae]|nr:Uncharacterised protein [Vibrio cholerae]
MTYCVLQMRNSIQPINLWANGSLGCSFFRFTATPKTILMR